MPDTNVSPGTISTNHLRATVEVPTEESLWAKSYEVVPRVVEQVFGDGLALIWVAPLNTRPNFYVVRVDSVLAADLDGDAFRDMIDEIIESIADQFGEHTDEPEHPMWGECCDWPVLNYDSGVSWGHYTLPGPWTYLARSRHL